MFNKFGLEDCENDAEEPDKVNALIARLRRGSSSRRSALESLEGSIFDNELPCSHSNERSSGNAHAKRRPATAGTRCNGPYGSARPHPCRHRYSHNGIDLDDQEQFQNTVGRGPPTALSSEQPRVRPQANLNSGFLTSRSCPVGQPRKVDRCVFPDSG